MHAPLYLSVQTNHFLYKKSLAYTEKKRFIVCTLSEATRRSDSGGTVRRECVHWKGITGIRKVATERTN